MCALCGSLGGGEHWTDAVAREEEHFRSLVQHATDVIAVLERDLTVRFVSPAVQPLLAPDEHHCG